MEGTEGDRTGRFLAGRNPVGRRLNSVVGRIADHVDERIAEFLDQRAVDFGFLPLEHEPDLLADLPRKVADEPRHLLKRATDRHHPQ